MSLIAADTDAWDALNPFDQYNLALPKTGPVGGPHGDIRPSIARAAGPGLRDIGNDAGPLHPDNPLLWAVGLGALTLGLIAASTQIRIGKARLAVSAGNTNTGASS